MFQKLISPIALAFLTDYPTPQSAALLGEGRMRQFCQRHSYRGGKSPAELVGRLRAGPASANPIQPKVLEAVVRSSPAQIGVLNTQIYSLERDLADALAAHPKYLLLNTLPRVATVSLAALIAEVGPLPDRCDNPEQVAAMCGAAPVTRASGMSRTVGFRCTATNQHAWRSPGSPTTPDTVRHGPATATAGHEHTLLRQIGGQSRLGHGPTRPRSRWVRWAGRAAGMVMRIDVAHR